MGWKVDRTWTLFLDRDGVINKRLMGGYVKTTSEFELLDGVAEALKMASGLFGRIVVVTNQQGIGKGLMTERNLSEIHAYCHTMIKEAGGTINAFYFAPELAGVEGTTRKPAIGMGLQAKAEFPEIDFGRSFMIGDSPSDIAFGKNLGMKTVFIETGTAVCEDADLNASSLLEAINNLSI